MKRLLTVAVLAAVGLSACGDAGQAESPYAGPEGQKRYCKEQGWDYVKHGVRTDIDDGPSGHCEMP